MKYLITGGAGFIGSHIARYLVNTGHDVVILDDLSSGSLENILHLTGNARARFIQGSITDPVILRSNCDEIDGIFHEAAVASVALSISDPRATNEVNVTGTLNVLIAARDAGVKKVVFASSAAIYGDSPALPKTETLPPCPKSPYAVSKLTGEEYMRVF